MENKIPSKADLTGQRFGRLIILQDSKQRKRGKILWLCQCDCGNQTLVLTERLKSGNTKSCGCLSKESAQKMGKQNLKNLVNEKFGKLTVIKKTDEKRGRHILWECLCDCGKKVLVRGDSLRRGDTQSCGCLFNSQEFKSRFKTHGASYTSLYSIWQGMRVRCYNDSAINFKNYGGKGIKICDEWKNNFMAFKRWSLSNGYQQGLTIDRIKAHQDYSPENCQWLTRSQNVRKAHLERRKEK